MAILTEHFKFQQAALGNNASEVDKLTVAQDTLSKKLDLQIQIVEQASQKYKAMAESESATASQVDNAQKAYIKQLTKLQELTNELDSVDQKLEEASRSEEEMATKSDEAATSTGNLASNISSTVAVIASLVSAAEQAVGAIADAATKTTEWADDLATTAEQIGVTTTTLQQWAYAADFVDVSVSTMQGSLSKLTQQMGQAQNGSASAQQAFKSLGVSIENADGSLRSSEEVFYDVIDALGGIQNNAERDAASMAIFGKSAQELNTLINAGSGSLREYGEEAEALGLVMSEEDVSALAQMQNSFDKLGSVMDASKRQLGADLAPAFSLLAEVIAHLDPTILKVIAGAGLFISTLSTLAPLLQGVAAITQLLTVAKTATAAATVVETAAETGLGVAALTTNAALLPQIAIAAGLLAAFAALAVAIAYLIDLFTDESEAAEKAARSTQKVADASRGADTTTTSTASSGNRHYALGGRVSGRKVWVGEQGAELVELPSGSTVYNHQESSSMASNNNVFNVTIDARSVDEFNKVVNVFNGLSQSMNRGGKVNG